MVTRAATRLGRPPHAVQLHWWGEAGAGLAAAAAALESCRREGLPRAVGVTNMSKPYLEVVCANAQVGFCQVALSLLARRPLGEVAEFCSARGIPIVAYGVLAGGFLADKWLGAAAPTADHVAPSQRKYLARIEAQGGWAEFQTLLAAAAEVGKRRGGWTVSQVAIAWALGQAAAVIIGPSSRTNRVLVSAARTLNAKSQSRVTLSLRQGYRAVLYKSSLLATAGGKWPTIRPKNDSRRPRQ